MKKLIPPAIRCSFRFTVTASLFSVQLAQAYTITLQEIGSDVCEWKRRAVFATTFCVLILCIVCPASVHAAKAPEKSDAELTKALIGTWELVPSPGLARKTFLEFNADGTSKAIGITTQRRVSAVAPWT